MSFTVTTVTNTGSANQYWSAEQMVCEQLHYRPDPTLPEWRFAVAWGGTAQTNVGTYSGGTAWGTGSLQGVAFGPGWWLTVEAHAYDSDTGKPAVFMHHLPMDRLGYHAAPPPAALLHEVARLVVAIETHEALENLRLGGHRVIDPHATGVPLYWLP